VETLPYLRYSVDWFPGRDLNHFSRLIFGRFADPLAWSDLADFWRKIFEPLLVLGQVDAREPRESKGSIFLRPVRGYCLCRSVLQIKGLLVGRKLRKSDYPAMQPATMVSVKETPCLCFFWSSLWVVLIIIDLMARSIDTLMSSFFLPDA